MKTFFSVFFAIICAAAVIALALRMGGPIGWAGDSDKRPAGMQGEAPPTPSYGLNSPAAIPSAASPSPRSSVNSGPMRVLLVPKVISLKYGTLTIPAGSMVAITGTRGETYGASCNGQNFTVLPSEVSESENASIKELIRPAATPPIKSIAPVAPPAKVAAVKAPIWPFNTFGHENISVTTSLVEWGASIKHNWETDWGSYDRDTVSHKLIDVELSPIGNNKRPATIEFYFVIRENGGSYKFLMHDRRESSDGIGKYTFSQTATRNDQRYVYLQEQYKSGNKIIGWLVRVVRSNTIVATAASSDQYLVYARDPEKLAASSIEVRERASADVSKVDSGGL